MIKIANIPNGVSKLNAIIQIDSDFSVTLMLSVFMASCKLSIKLSILGMFTSFAILSFLSNTSALVPSEEISISFTSPASILATNSEYANLLLELSNIEVITTIKITNIMSHIANVLILFFNFVCLLFVHMQGDTYAILLF